MISILIVGLIVGGVARFLLPGQDPMGVILTTLFGIGGSYAGSFIGQKLGFYQMGEPVSLMGSIVGAIALLIVYRIIRKA